MKKYLIKFNKFLQKVDNIAPNPWIVNNVVQVRPVTQLGIIIGFIFGFILYYLIF